MDRSRRRTRARRCRPSAVTASRRLPVAANGSCVSPLVKPPRLGRALSTGRRQYRHSLARTAGAARSPRPDQSTPSAKRAPGHRCSSRSRYGAVAVRGHQQWPDLVPRRPAQSHPVASPRRARSPEGHRVSRPPPLSTFRCRDMHRRWAGASTRIDGAKAAWESGVRVAR